MKASELIKRLQELVEEHGDLPCDYAYYLEGSGEDFPRVENVEVYDEKGYHVIMGGTPYIITIGD